MPTNIEIKACVRDLAALRKRSESLSDIPVQVIPQEDTFFNVRRGRLKLRQLSPGRGQLVYYERANAPGPKRSDYLVVETSDPSALKAALTAALGVRGIVRKTRYLYMVGQTRVHLDDVEGLGTFMELEVVLRPGQSQAEGTVIAVKLMKKFGVKQADLVEAAYMDLIEEQINQDFRSEGAWPPNEHEKAEFCGGATLLGAEFECASESSVNNKRP